MVVIGGGLGLVQTQRGKHLCYMVGFGNLSFCMHLFRIAEYVTTSAQSFSLEDVQPQGSSSLKNPLRLGSRNLWCRILLVLPAPVSLHPLFLYGPIQPVAQISEHLVLCFTYSSLHWQWSNGERCFIVPFPTFVALNPIRVLGPHPFIRPVTVLPFYPVIKLYTLFSIFFSPSIIVFLVASFLPTQCPMWHNFVPPFESQFTSHIRCCIHGILQGAGTLCSDQALKFSWFKAINRLVQDNVVGGDIF